MSIYNSLDGNNNLDDILRNMLTKNSSDSKDFENRLVSSSIRILQEKHEFEPATSAKISSFVKKMHSKYTPTKDVPANCSSKASQEISGEFEFYLFIHFSHKISSIVHFSTEQIVYKHIYIILQHIKVYKINQQLLINVYVQNLFSTWYYIYIQIILIVVDSKPAVHSKENGISKSLKKEIFPLEQICLEWPSAHRIGSGLKNLGNTCFLNSTLQCLIYTAPLYNYLISGFHSKKCKYIFSMPYIFYIINCWTNYYVSHLRSLI